MMFSKLSIFVAATLAAFAIAAGPLPQGGSGNIDNVPKIGKTDNVKTDDTKTQSCPSGPVKCCKSYFKYHWLMLFIFFL